jgi:hypothetical protein
MKLFIEKSSAVRKHLFTATRQTAFKSEIKETLQPRCTFIGGCSENYAFLAWDVVSGSNWTIVRPQYFLHHTVYTANIVRVQCSAPFFIILY